MGQVKGAGTDCLMMLAEAYEACGVIPHLEIPFDPADWNLHRDAERYLDGATQYAIEISGPPQPGAVPAFFASAAATPTGRSWSNGRGSSTRVTMGMIYGDATQPKLASRNRVF
jgi:hypothetical protein